MFEYLNGLVVVLWIQGKQDMVVIKKTVFFLKKTTYNKKIKKQLNRDGGVHTVMYMWACWISAEGHKDTRTQGQGGISKSFDWCISIQ